MPLKKSICCIQDMELKSTYKCICINMLTKNGIKLTIIGGIFCFHMSEAIYKIYIEMFDQTAKAGKGKKGNLL